MFTQLCAYWPVLHRSCKWWSPTFSTFEGVCSKTDKCIYEQMRGYLACKVEKSSLGGLLGALNTACLEHWIHTHQSHQSKLPKQALTTATRASNNGTVATSHYSKGIVKVGMVNMLDLFNSCPPAWGRANWPHLSCNLVLGNTSTTRSSDSCWKPP